MKALFTAIFLGLAFMVFCPNLQAQMYILNEDFTTATGITPPTNWSNTTVTGQPTDKWHFDNPGSRTLNFPMIAPFAIFDHVFFAGTSDNIHIYSPIAHDADIISIDSPVIPFLPGIHPLKVTIQNFGVDVITTTTIKWTINGVQQTPYVWAGNPLVG